MRLILLAVAVAAGLATAAVQAKSAPPEVKTVPSVDLKRYAGTWYEIANFPMFFQRKCTGETTAVYTANEDGTIAVTNRCRKEDGEFDEANGTATVVPDSGNAKLEVSFFKPFKGDYWIIGLDPAYRWAVVGAPDRDYLWILSRTPAMAPADLDRALDAARAQGYTFEDLQFTRQNGEVSKPSRQP